MIHERPTFRSYADTLKAAEISVERHLGGSLENLILDDHRVAAIEIHGRNARVVVQNTPLEEINFDLIRLVALREGTAISYALVFDKGREEALKRNESMDHLLGIVAHSLGSSFRQAEELLRELALAELQKRDLQTAVALGFNSGKGIMTVVYPSVFEDLSKVGGQEEKAADSLFTAIAVLRKNPNSSPSIAYVMGR